MGAMGVPWVPYMGMVPRVPYIALYIALYIASGAAPPPRGRLRYLPLFNLLPTNFETRRPRLTNKLYEYKYKFINILVIFPDL